MNVRTERWALFIICPTHCLVIIETEVVQAALELNLWYTIICIYTKNQKGGGDLQGFIYNKINKKEAA